MEKKRFKKSVLVKNGKSNYYLIMRLTLFLMIIFNLGVNAKGFSQFTLTMNLGEVTYKEVFEEIRKQTGCIVMFNDSMLDKNGRVEINFENESLEKILEDVLKPNGLKYEKSGEFIVILKDKNQLPQQKIIFISGKVTDTSGQPLPGVSVFIKGTTIGVATDIDGIYKLEIPDSEGLELMFSFIGMESKGVVYNGQKEINITLEEELSEIEEVVITGYQKIERRKLTSSVSTVNMDVLKTVNQPNIDKLLQGQVPGMTIISTSGAPGAVPQIRIRGTSTISGNVQPLWVVDGIILDDPVEVNMDDLLTNRNLIASGIGGVNVDDIESINVLKDAAATAIYGTRAANGVIVITSKKGTAGKTRINYNGSLTIGMRPKITDAYMMNSKDRTEVSLEMLEKGILKASSSENGMYGTVSDFEKYFVDVHDRKISWEDFQNKVNRLEEVNTDWFKHLFRNSVTNRHSISVSGGNEMTNFYLSGSYMDEQATAKDVGMQTYTASMKVYTKLRDNIRLGGMLDVNMRNNKSFFAVDSRENPYEYAIQTTRAHNVYDENGNYNYFYYNDLKYNFLENRESSWRKSKSFGLKGTLDFEWRILPDLTFSTLFSFSKQNTTDYDIATEDSYFVRARKKDMWTTIDYISQPIWNDGGYKKTNFNNNSSITFRNQISYMPSPHENHRFDIMLGQEIRTSKHEGETTQVYGYSHDKGHQQVPQFDLMEYMGTPYWTENLSETATVSWFGVLGYTFMNRYTVSFNARVDGSNRFGVKTNDLFQPLWAIGLNYQLKEENFLRNIKWIDYLTVKGSYGSQGNVASQAYSDLVATIGKIDNIKNENFLVINAPKNPNLKWEKNYTVNAALEYGFFKRRITGSIEYYYKKGVDLLGNKQVSLVSGFPSIQVNWASMKNTGFEFYINTLNIDSDGFRWNTNVNFGFNKNEVLDVYSTPTYTTLTNPQRTNYEGAAVVGKPINGLWSYKFAGLNEEGRAKFYTNELDEETGEYKTVLTGMNDIEGLEYSGTTMPKTQMGFTNIFYYKKFTLSALFIGSFGNVIRLRNLTTGYVLAYPEATQNLPKEFVYRWRQSGDEEKTNIPRLEENQYEDALFYPYPSNGQMYNNSNLRTVKGNFLRLQNLSLSYDIFSDKLRSSGIQNIRVMLQGYNLHVWKNSKLKGQDPEATGSVMKYSDSRNANVSFGNTYLPLPRTYTLSVSVQF